MTIEFVQLLQDMLGDLEGTPSRSRSRSSATTSPTLAIVGGAHVQARSRRSPGWWTSWSRRAAIPSSSLHVDPTRAAKAGFTVAQITTPARERPAWTA